jgi:glutaconate CoA-transferase subunit B
MKEQHVLEASAEAFADAHRSSQGRDMSGTDFTPDEMMTIAASRALKRHRCLLCRHRRAVGCLQHRPADPRSRHVTLIYESGTIGTSRLRFCPCRLATENSATRPSPPCRCPKCFATGLQGGRVTVGFLGAAQIDRFGNINTTVIGDYDEPENPAARRWRRAGDRILLRRNLYHAQAVQTRHGRKDRFRTPASDTAKVAITVSRMGIATKGPTLMVTDLAVWKPDPETLEFTVVSMHPGVSSRDGSGGPAAGPVRFRR